MSEIMARLGLRPDPLALLRGEQGQATAEYAVLAAVSVFVILAVVQTLTTALFDYYQDVASLICLPIP